MEKIMDPIITALIAGATASVQGIASQVITDTYNAIKNKITEKFGKQNEALSALEKLEAKPKSDARKNVLAEDLSDLDISKDNELIELAQKLIKAMESETNGAQHIKNIQNVTGNDNVVVGPGSTVNIKR